MRIRFKKANLIQPTSIVNSVAPQVSPTPVLCNVLIRTEHDNMVSLVAADYETRVRVEVIADVEEHGSVLIPAKTFSDLVKELPEDSELTLETSVGSAFITASGVKAKLQTMPVVDYPHAQEFDPDFSLDIPQEPFHHLLSAVTFAIAQRETRKVFLGCCFDFLGDALQANATDGKMMALAKIPLESEGIPKNRQIIIPRKLLVELSNILVDEGNLTMQVAERAVSVSVGNVCFVSNLIDGTFPNWENVMPKSFAYTVRLPRYQILSALRRANVIMDIKTPSVKIDITDEEVRVKADSYDRGQFTETIEAQNSIGQKYPIGLNFGYLNNVLKVLNDTDILMMCNEPNKPVVFTVACNPDTSYLVMPVRLPREVEEKQEADASEEDDEEPVGPGDSSYNDED